jgi:hypothetical protein
MPSGAVCGRANAEWRGDDMPVASGHGAEGAAR